MHATKKLRRAWEIGYSIVAKAMNPILEKKLGFQEEDRLPIGEVPEGWTLDKARRKIDKHMDRLKLANPDRTYWVAGYLRIYNGAELEAHLPGLSSLDSLGRDRLSRQWNRYTTEHAAEMRRWFDKLDAEHAPEQEPTKPQVPSDLAVLTAIFARAGYTSRFQLFPPVLSLTVSQQHSDVVLRFGQDGTLLGPDGR